MHAKIWILQSTRSIYLCLCLQGGTIVARIDKSKITKLEIIQVAAHKFLEKGYSNTSLKEICDPLKMSTGNLTFYFQTKEHLLAELVDILCNFQRKMMEVEAKEGFSSLMSVCLELTAMAAMCEEDAVARDFYLSAYTSPLCLDIVRQNDARRAKDVFAPYCSHWSDSQFTEAEALVSGIEYATMMTTESSAPLELRITGALNAIMMIYNVPEETRKIKISKVLKMNYLELGQRMLKEFREHVEKTTKQAFLDLLKR